MGRCWHVCEESVTGHDLPLRPAPRLRVAVAEGRLVQQNGRPFWAKGGNIRVSAGSTATALARRHPQEHPPNLLARQGASRRVDVWEMPGSALCELSRISQIRLLLPDWAWRWPGGSPNCSPRARRSVACPRRRRLGGDRRGASGRRQSHRQAGAWARVRRGVDASGCVWMGCRIHQGSRTPQVRGSHSYCDGVGGRDDGGDGNALAGSGGLWRPLRALVCFSYFPSVLSPSAGLPPHAPGQASRRAVPCSLYCAATSPCPRMPSTVTIDPPGGRTTTEALYITARLRPPDAGDYSLQQSRPRSAKTLPLLVLCSSYQLAIHHPSRPCRTLSPLCACLRRRLAEPHRTALLAPSTLTD